MVDGGVVRGDFGGNGGVSIGFGESRIYSGAGVGARAVIVNLEL